MANRFIKSSIWTSPNLNDLSNEAELLFYRLLPLPDDHGCFLADPRVLKGIVFPLKSIWSIDVICRQLSALADNGVLKLWVKDGRLYGMFPNWAKHQRIRSLFQRKTPVPPDNFDNHCQEEVRKLLLSIDVNSPQIGASLPSSLFPLPSSNNNKVIKPKRKSTADPVKREIAEKFVALYTKYLVEPGYARTVKELSDARISHINQRFKDKPDWDKWETFFRDYIPKSRFLRGEVPPTNNRPQFKIGIDWLTRESTIIDIREGKYHGQ
jgi:hypothetical protein